MKASRFYVYTTVHLEGIIHYWKYVFITMKNGFIKKMYVSIYTECLMSYKYLKVWFLEPL